MLQNKESNLVSVPTIKDEDRLRLVQDESSRNIRYTDLVTDLTDRIIDPDADKMVSYRTIVANDVLYPDVDEIILIDCQTGDVTLTLPPAADAITIAGKSPTYTVKKISGDTFDGHIDAQVGETVDGVQTINLIGDRFPFIKIMSTGNEWLIIS